MCQPVLPPDSFRSYFDRKASKCYHMLLRWIDSNALVWFFFGFRYNCKHVSALRISSAAILLTYEQKDASSMLRNVNSVTLVPFENALHVHLQKSPAKLLNFNDFRGYKQKAANWLTTRFGGCWQLKYISKKHGLVIFYFMDNFQ